MAKYSRYDSRNKKRNRHKDLYLGRGSQGRRNREIHEGNVYHEQREKYRNEETDIPSLYW